MQSAHNSAEIQTLADALERHEIRYVFVYTSYLGRDGQFTETYSHAADFVRTLKTSGQGIEVQAWIGLPLEYVDLRDIAVRRKIAAFCADVVSGGGFDGVHLDPEPIVNDDAYVLLLLDETRSKLGADADLSMATRRIWPVLPAVRWPLAGKVAWLAGYYREIAMRVNQVAVMTYDSALPLPSLYRHWTRFQVIEISRALDGSGTLLLVGIPTSEERTWTHWPNAENMTSGLQGLVDGLNDGRARPNIVTGAAVYPYWETDQREWATYRQLWLGR